MAVWHTEQVWVPGVGMWPGGLAVLVQSVVLWHPEQSPVASWPPAAVWLAGGPCTAGGGAPMKKFNPASWQVSQAAGTKACLAALMLVGPKVAPTTWQELQSALDRYGMCTGVSTAAFGLSLLL